MRAHFPTLPAAALLAVSIFAPPPLAAQITNAPMTFDTAAVLASAKAEIEAANEAWLPGLRRHDAASIVAAYADSGLFVTTDGRVIRGRAAIAQLYEARFPQLKEIRDGGVVQEGLAAVTPTLIYEWGRAWMEMAPAHADAAPTRGGGRYLTVWQRERDGHWRIARNLAF